MSVRGKTRWIGIRRHAEDIDNAAPEQWSTTSGWVPPAGRHGRPLLSQGAVSQCRPAGGTYQYRSSTMPKLTVEGVGAFEVPAGKRLVLALEDEAGVDQLHACG